MHKKELKKIILSIIVIILFSLVLVTIFSFNKNSENIEFNGANNTEEDSPKEEQDTFTNNSDIEEKDIRLLVEEKRLALKEYLSHVKYYKLSDISANYQSSDDSYIGIPQSFFSGLKELVTDELYNSYFSKCTLVETNNNPSIKENIYASPINLFDETYTNSAVAVNDVNTEILILKNATNERVEAKEEIKICSADTNSCTRDSFYSLVLEKENEIWKIAKIS